MGEKRADEENYFPHHLREREATNNWLVCRNWAERKVVDKPAWPNISTISGRYRSLSAFSKVNIKGTRSRVSRQIQRKRKKDSSEKGSTRARVPARSRSAISYRDGDNGTIVSRLVAYPIWINLQLIARLCLIKRISCIHRVCTLRAFVYPIARFVLSVSFFDTASYRIDRTRSVFRKVHYIAGNSCIKEVDCQDRIAKD